MALKPSRRVPAASVPRHSRHWAAAAAAAAFRLCPTEGRHSLGVGEGSGKSWVVASGGDWWGMRGESGEMVSGCWE